jgi:hypothetical protein
MKDEVIVAVAPQFNLDGVTRTVGDLVFTSSQVLFAKTAGNADVLGLAFGAIGAAIAAASSREASEALQAQPLDRLIAASEPRHRFDYHSLESIELKPRRFFSSVVVVRPREGKRRKFWGKRKNLLKLVENAPQLAALGAPIHVA